MKKALFALLAVALFGAVACSRDPKPDDPPPPPPPGPGPACRDFKLPES